MPIPQTFVYDNHVCIKINDVLNHILSNGVDIPLIKSSSFDNMSVDNSSLLNTLVVYNISKEVNMTSKNAFQMIKLEKKMVMLSLLRTGNS